MDVATIILGIALINLAVFLAGCALAAVRTVGERSAAGRSPRALIRRHPVAGSKFGHAGRRAH